MITRSKRAGISERVMAKRPIWWQSVQLSTLQLLQAGRRESSKSGEIIIHLVEGKLSTFCVCVFRTEEPCTFTVERRLLPRHTIQTP